MTSGDVWSERNHARAGLIDGGGCHGPAAVCELLCSSVHIGSPFARVRPGGGIMIGGSHGKLFFAAALLQPACCLLQGTPAGLAGQL